ncbi:MAG: hypothetical protein JOS17DRAFT_761729, partial [Linnemannia elongata]
MNSSCSFCISTSLFLPLLLSFVYFSFALFFSPSSIFKASSSYLPVPFFFLCCSQIVHSFLQLHHPLTTSSSLLFQTHSVVVHPSNVDSLG